MNTTVTVTTAFDAFTCSMAALTSVAIVDYNIGVTLLQLNTKK